MFYIEFSFNGTKRRREMAALPRVGEIVDLPEENDERIVLRVDLVVHHVDEDGKADWHCNCTVMQDWLTKAP